MSGRTAVGGERRPWGRRVLLGFLLGMLILLLLVDGFTTKTIGASSTGSGESGPALLAGSRPVLVSDGHGGLVSHQPPPGRRIALTFDDGPSPEWTPKIAAILRARHVPATFFEVGAQVVRYPGITRMLHDGGFQLGDHTFTHANLVGMPAWEAQLQVSLAESAISGVTGIRPRLVRPPYSSTPEAVTPNQLHAWGALASKGYIITLANYDTEDWSRPGVQTILSNVLDNPSIRRGVGGIVLMHDAGGNRAETVAALPRLIAALRARGFRFATVTELAGLSPAQTQVPASAGQQLRGRAFDTMLGLAGTVTNLLTRLVMLVTVLVGLRMLAGLVLARVQLRRTRSLRGDPDFRPAVSVLVPAHNEQVGIERAVRSLAESDYGGELEVIVVDDGSTDDTAAIVQRLTGAPAGGGDSGGAGCGDAGGAGCGDAGGAGCGDAGGAGCGDAGGAGCGDSGGAGCGDSGGLGCVRLLRQPNAGKAAALNRALAASRHEIVVTVDADTVFEPETLARLVRRFGEPDVGAISGNTKVGNRQGLIGRWQHIEYVMGFNLDRRMYEVLGSTPTVPGAIGAFRRRALEDIGGVSGATLAEDTDITLDIGRAGWRVVYESSARAWTEAPSTVRALYRQRSRWAYGTIQSMWKHRHALWGGDAAGNPRSHNTGGARPHNTGPCPYCTGAPGPHDTGGARPHNTGARAVMAIALFQVLLPLCAPLIDLFAIYSVVFLDPMPILAFWGAFNLFQLVLAWAAFGFDEERRTPLWALPLQQLLHRQISYLVVYDALISALLGSSLSWHRVDRTGEVTVLADARESVDAPA